MSGEYLRLQILHCIRLRPSEDSVREAKREPMDPHPAILNDGYSPLTSWLEYASHDAGGVSRG
jgi:hypothetical protein